MCLERERELHSWMENYFDESTELVLYQEFSVCVCIEKDFHARVEKKLYESLNIHEVKSFFNLFSGFSIFLTWSYQTYLE